MIKGGVKFPAISYKVGVELESGISTLFAFQYGLTYSSLLGTPIAGVSAGRLAIPLWFKFRFLQDKPFGFYVGPGVSLNIITAIIRSASIVVYDFGVGGLVGVQYYINDKFKIFLDVDASFYVLTLSYEVSITPGVAFTFGRNT